MRGKVHNLSSFAVVAFPLAWRHRVMGRRTNKALCSWALYCHRLRAYQHGCNHRVRSLRRPNAGLGRVVLTVRQCVSRPI